MKKITLMIFILFPFAYLLFGQNSFELLIENDNSQIISDIVEMSDGSYVLVGYGFNPSNYENVKGLIFKIDRDGTIVNNKLVNEFSYCRFLNVHTYNNVIIIIAMVQEFESNHRKLGIFKYSPDLELLGFELNLMPTNVSISSLNSIVDSDENIVICGLGMPVTSEDFLTKLYYKTSLEGDSLASKFSFSEFQNIPMGIIENNNQDGYNVFVSRHYNGWSSMVSFDSNLEIIDTLVLGSGQYLEDSLFSSFFVSPAKMNDSTIFASGINTNSSYLDGIFVIKIMDEDTLVKQKYIESNTPTRQAIYYSNSSYDNNYYTAYTSNFSNQTTLSNDTSHIHIVKLDDELEIIWHKIIGGDAYNVLFRILATSDGGCILSIYRYEENPDYNVNAYIVKLNKDGNLLWNKEIPLKNSAILYPNPVKNELFIDLSENIVIDEINIINMSGEIVLNKTNISFPLNLNNLSNGSYILQIKTNQGLITNKFTKID